MNQYLPQEGTVSLIVFKNERRTSEKAPTHNVIVTMPDGTKYEGGLFSKTGKSGIVFHTGTLRDQRTNPYTQQRQQASAPAAEVSVDF
jgi:hypothetical protein